ncbi:hypothetical protein GOP47_0005199 [Adiantum capillus-veneris]|uniref:Uncharacterized protein n=1 Tax=Adiantum capillus-veneris TaxID=13818 RepID=A0A9D4ZNX6_ADICA|nr:hypothetical protein GOP47_0005199 [Adiantum capillus-veneris]
MALVIGIKMSSLSRNGASQPVMPTKILCLAFGYTFSKYFSPLLSYTVPYLVRIKSLTNFQVTNKILPLYSYAKLLCTLLAAPACEYISYKTLIIAGSFSALLAKLMLRFGTTLASIQIVEVFEACSDATYFVYQAYLFLLVNETHFQKMTSITQGSVSTALFISSELGQILVLVGTPLNDILHVTIVSTVIRCILAFMLPKKQIEIEEKPQFVLSFISKDQGLWSVLKETWADKCLQLLSIWWAFALAGLDLTLNYGPNLIETLDSASTYNGQALAIGTGLSIIVAFSSVHLREAVAKLGGFLYIGGSLVYGVLCLGFAYSQTVWLAYVLYIIMLGVEKLLLCFLYAQCGSLVKNDRYALMFSFNCGLSQAVQVVVQALLEIAGVDIVGLYKAFGYYFLGIAFLFSILYGIYMWKARKVAIVSLEEETPNLNKANPFREPLMDSEVSSTHDDS